MKTVLLVCTGNTCRSAMAGAALRHLLRQRLVRGVEVRSAGLLAMPGDTMPSYAHLALSRAGIAPGDHRARLLDADEVADADFIVAMTKQHAQDILERFPEAAPKTRTLLSFAGVTADVSDPIGGSAERYVHCLQIMTMGLEGLIKALTQPEPKPGKNHGKNHAP
ncbi:MAG: low molecular weight protein arginine phosphatase [bacterium]